MGISGWELVISSEALSIVRSRDCIAGLAARPLEEGDLRRVNIIGDAVHARLRHVKAGAVSGDGEGCALVKHRGGVAQIVDGHCSSRRGSAVVGVACLRTRAWPWAENPLANIDSS